jgi:hypothetical protein
VKPTWLAALAVLAAACGGDGGPSVTRADSAGVEIVTYAGPDVPLAWTFDSLFTLGGSDEGEDSFYEVHPAVVGADAAGLLYVLDRSAKRIVVFDSTGAFVRAMGGPGGGPGEMEWPGALAVAPDGRAGAYDFAKRALVWFGPDNALLDQELIVGGFNGGALHVSDTGLVLPWRVWGGEVSDPGRDELLRVAGGDTTRLVSVPGAPGKSTFFKSCGMGISGIPPVFWPSLRWAAAGDRVAVTTVARYEVLLLSGADSTHIIRRLMEPAAATTEAAVREIGDAFRVRTTGGERACDTDEVVEQLGVADHIPIIAEIAAGPDDTWWVRRRAAAGVDVYAADGAYLGTLPASAPYPLVSLRGSRIAGIVTDELDVQRLVVYRVRMDDR